MGFRVSVYSGVRGSGVQRLVGWRLAAGASLAAAREHVGGGVQGRDGFWFWGASVLPMLHAGFLPRTCYGVCGILNLKRGFYETRGPQNLDPHIVGFPFHKDPSKVPRCRAGTSPARSPWQRLRPRAKHPRSRQAPGVRV